MFPSSPPCRICLTLLHLIGSDHLLNAPFQGILGLPAEQAPDFIIEKQEIGSRILNISIQGKFHMKEISKKSIVFDGTRSATVGIGKILNFFPSEKAMALKNHISCELNYQ